MLNFTIRQEESDQTLISFLKRRFKTTPLSLIYKLFSTKKIKVNGENIRYYHHRLKAGEQIVIHDNYLKTAVAKTTIFPLSQSKVYFEITYEDPNILIVVKEHGITMLNLDNDVRHYLAEKDPTEYRRQIENFFVLTAVHRLDKLTQGLVIYPKNPMVKKILYKAISDKNKITKKYLAFCEKLSRSDLPNYISGYLEKNDSEHKMQFSLNPTTSQVKFCAILSYFGYPIVGDKKYGSSVVMNNKIGLLAYQLEFHNLPSPLAYLNNRIFAIPEGEIGYQTKIYKPWGIEEKSKKR
ncbi:5333_t:CDS:2, partial [Racocetra fulgida]